MASAKESPLDVNEKDHSLILMRSLDLMRKEKQGCDLTIKVDDEEIQVHRVVMSAMSDYFKAMFAHDTVENRSGIVEMKGVGFKFVKKGVEHIYGGKVSISEDDCEEFLVATTMMQLPMLFEKIQRFLACCLNPKKFFDLKSIAERFNCKILQESCNEYALMNLGAISEEKEFGELEMNYISYLMKDETSPYKEDCKLSVLLKWIKFDIENRGKLLVEMFQLLDLKNISVGFKTYLVENEELVFNSLGCLKMFFLNVASSIGAKAQPAKVPFSGSTNSLVVCEKSTMSLQAYRPLEKSWRILQPLRENMATDACTAVVLGKFLYVLRASKKAYKIEILGRESEWLEISDMLAVHGSYPSATVHGNSIYIAGHNSIERYTQCEDKWENVDDEGISPNFCTIVELNDCIYLLGGKNGRRGLRDVHAFLTMTPSWFGVPPMLYERQIPAAAVYGEKIFVAGGFCLNVSDTFEVYDLKTDAWSLLTQMMSPRDGFRLVNVGGNKLFSVGSRMGDRFIEAYDLQTNKWESVDETENVIAPLSAVALWLPAMD